jgi:mannose-6-phosphate isomerase-like protein (cupin superfamily)
MKPRPEALLLIPNGYPLWIDVAQTSVNGLGTAMRFVLPVKGHNLPLMHTRESKLVVALDGQLDIRVGRQTVAHLQKGEAVTLETGLAHRIHQSGSQPCTVGVVLCPGQVENAFRELSAAVATGHFDRRQMAVVLDKYEVVWTSGKELAGLAPLAVRPFIDCLDDLPPLLAAWVWQYWG